MKHYTIKSTSAEGVYYLVNHWEKHKTYWIEPERIKTEMFFNTARSAKCSLTKLLKVMTEYATDHFELIEI